MKNFRLPFFILVFTFFVSACAQATPEPTPTPTATALPPTATFTPEPTATQVPTNTPEPTATRKPTATDIPFQINEDSLITTVNVPEGGFSFRLPLGFEHSIQGDIALAANRDEFIFLSIQGGTAEPGDTLENTLDELIAIFSKNIQNMNTDEPFEISIAGADGLGVQLTGVLGEPVDGQLITVLSDTGQTLNIMMTVRKGEWDTIGQPLADALFAKIQFGDASAAGGVCPIASDPTYGYAQENPVLVGGDAFGGPSRARAYLDNLRGPNGEKVSYERGGSIFTDESILDSYNLSYAGSGNIVIYVNQYSFETLQAPVGFTCDKAFIAAP